MRSSFHSLVTVYAIAVLLPSAFAQREVYPQKEGIQQPSHFDEIPKWMTLDTELRGRTEEQTSLGYVSGKDRIYELTRVWGGLTVRPTDWLTGYLQFLDNHALGLPLRDVAANMRDVFDFRQGYLNFHYEPAQLIVVLIKALSPRRWAEIGELYVPGRQYLCLRCAAVGGNGVTGHVGGQAACPHHLLAFCLAVRHTWRFVTLTISTRGR
jgi:hypothetical protein